MNFSMNLRKIINTIFYIIKPIMPRRIQLWLRRILIQMKLPSVADSWPILESAAKTPANWTGWPQNKQFGLVLMHDVETQIGQDRCIQLAELEKKYNLRSSFNFVPERYTVSAELRHKLTEDGFEVAVHGLNHDGKLYRSKDLFYERAAKINRYIAQWNAVGFCAPASHHVLEWNYALDIDYNSSTFDTDPFESQPDGANTIFPFWVSPANYPNAEYQDHTGYVELPYTLPQDFYLCVLMKHEDATIWKQKLDWIAEKGGMALLITHPDYMCFGDTKRGFQEYPAAIYEEFLAYATTKYKNQYWHGLPKELASYYKTSIHSRLRENQNLAEYATNR